MTSDLTFALRFLKRRPVVASTIVLTLGLTVGGAGAIFSLIRSILLAPIAVHDPARVVVITERNDAGAYEQLSLGRYRGIVRSSDDFEGVAAFFTTTLGLARPEATVDVSASLVTADYFRLLGVPAIAGRWFSPTDTADGSWNREIVLSYRFWQTQYGGSRDVVGQRVSLNGHAMTVIGIMPAAFAGTVLSGTPDAWVALSAAPSFGLTLIVDGQRLDERTPVYSVVGRLRRGASVGSAARNLNTVAQRESVGETPRPDTSQASGAADGRFRLTPVNDAAIVGESRTRIVQLLVSIAALVGITVLLACINIASILTALGHHRSPEFGVRIALGASRGRLYRQVGTECAMLAVAGAVVGLLFSIVALGLVSHFSLPGGVALDRLNLHVDVRTCVFIAVATLAATVLFGTLPARQAAAASAIGALRSPIALKGTSRVVLLAAQVAISVMLLIGAGLFIRSMAAGLRTDMGFDPAGISVLAARSPFAGKHVDVVQPYLQLATALKRISGLRVAFGSHVPLEGTWKERSFPGPLGMARDPRAVPVMMGMETVSDDYFSVLGMPMVSGRAFNAGDSHDAPRVAILNEAAARRLFPGQSPIGQTMTAGPIFDYTVVGVVRDARYMTLQDSGVPFAYSSLMQGDLRGRIRFVVRSADPRQTLSVIRHEAAAYGTVLKSMRLALESDRLADAVMPQRIGARLLSALALIAVCIAAVGIYGTVSYVVSQRTSEIGIRRALGANSADVVKLVLAQCAISIAIGVGCGVAGSVLAGDLVSHFLFRIAPTDGVAFAGAITFMAMIAASAALVPAWRAVRVDAVSAIRSAM